VTVAFLEDLSRTSDETMEEAVSFAVTGAWKKLKSVTMAILRNSGAESCVGNNAVGADYGRT
jgi:hypothetical protein